MRLGWVTETVGLRRDCDSILISSFSLLCTIDAVSMRGRGEGGEGGGEEEERETQEIMSVCVHVVEGEGECEERGNKRKYM